MMMKRTLKNEEKQIYIRQGSAGIQRQTGEGLVGKQDLHVVLLLLLYRYYVLCCGVDVVARLLRTCARLRSLRTHGCVRMRAMRLLRPYVLNMNQ